MTKIHGEIDGWKIELYRQNDITFPWKATAFDSLWQRHVSVEGFDETDALSALASKIGIAPNALLKVFGF